MNPRIGITCARVDSEKAYQLRHQYVEAVRAAGGIPLILPSAPAPAARETAPAIDGLLLSGGGDVDPAWYGEEPRLTIGNINPVADQFELELARLFIAEGRPVLGICRGMQVLNVAAGGDLYQDVVEQTGTKLRHSQTAPEWHPTHRVNVVPGTRLHRIVGADEIRVNSFHHQGVRTVAPGWVASARASDGLVEGIEHPGSAFMLGVQWHPERTYAGSETDFALFRAFVHAAGGR